MAECLKFNQDQKLYSSCYLVLKGLGLGRDGAINHLLQKGNLKIHSVFNLTNLPHNGCRPRALRRI